MCLGPAGCSGDRGSIIPEPHHQIFARDTKFRDVKIRDMPGYGLKSTLFIYETGIQNGEGEGLSNTFWLCLCSLNLLSDTIKIRLFET
jgi:hypothetical protein